VILLHSYLTREKSSLVNCFNTTKSLTFWGHPVHVVYTYAFEKLAVTGKKHSDKNGYEMLNFLDFNDRDFLVRR